MGGFCSIFCDYCNFGKEDAELTNEKIKFLKENTSFNEFEIEEWHKCFLKDCPKGYLSKKQFIQTFTKLYQTKKNDFYESLFDTFDSDHNGRINFVEFLLAISLTSQKEPRKKLRLVFKIYDLNKDGQLEMKEIVKVLKSILTLGERRRSITDLEVKSSVQEMFHKLDVNKDNLISEEEFVEGCLNNPEIMRTLNSFS